MREKYIDERFPRIFKHWWYILGNDTEREVELTDIPNEMITEHNLVLDNLVNISLLLSRTNPNIFEDYWYNGMKYDELLIKYNLKS